VSVLYEKRGAEAFYRVGNGEVDSEERTEEVSISRMTLVRKQIETHLSGVSVNFDCALSIDTAGGG